MLEILGDLVKIDDVEIQPAKDQDMNQILSLINNTNREWYSRIIPEEHWIEPFLTRKQLDEMATFMEFSVQRVDGEIISVGSFGVRDEKTARIPLMYVRSDYQRKCIGSDMIHFLEEIARERNFQTIHIETDSEAKWAVGFYEKHDYTLFKKDKNPWGYHIWMKKQL